MLSSRLFLVAAAGLAVGYTMSVYAQDKPSLGLGSAQDKPTMSLNANEGIFVDPASFAIMKGVAKSDPAAKITKFGAREVITGAVIFRVGDKLYIADANPAQKSLYNAFWEEYERSSRP
jgi:hypothetical protein